jgi:hypothetical protein
MPIKNKIPLFKPFATELGFDSKELSAAALHIAHWEKFAAGSSSKISSENI